uniref:Uncharacterized protein n=1 Tax=Cacopsylla melanoneura TaxID=428564 RepID=A0A8D9EBF4_9HEMI
MCNVWSKLCPLPLTRLFPYISQEFFYILDMSVFVEFRFMLLFIHTVLYTHTHLLFIQIFVFVTAVVFLVLCFLISVLFVTPCGLSFSSWLVVTFSIYSYTLTAGYSLFIKFWF